MGGAGAIWDPDYARPQTDRADFWESQTQRQEPALVPEMGRGKVARAGSRWGALPGTSGACVIGANRRSLLSPLPRVSQLTPGRSPRDGRLLRPSSRPAENSIPFQFRRPPPHPEAPWGA